MYPAPPVTNTLIVPAPREQIADSGRRGRHRPGRASFIGTAVPRIGNR